VNLQSMEKLFIHELKDIYSAEKQLLKALPKMAKSASNDKLREGFETHLKETEEHVNRIEQIFEDLDGKPSGVKCEGMAGLIEEGEEVVEADGDDAVKDAALIAAAQKVEHYEIASYGTVRTMAGQLGYTRAQELLQQTLKEEAMTDEKLTKLAESSPGINQMAAR
jgi:ferritin-like metal-binding protein YciE